MPLRIRFTKVTPLYPTRVFLQWDLLDPTESGSYTFTIERSGSIAGPWELLKAGAQNNYNYIDDLKLQPLLPSDGKANLFSLQRQIYYRVTVIPPSGCTNGARTEPHGIEGEIHSVAAGLRRRLQYDESIVFKRVNGVRLALLKRRHWGERCPDCYDPVTRSITKEHCVTCWGTGFIDGYWNPVVVFGRINTPFNTNAQTSERDKVEAVPQLITLPDVPALQDNDLIVEIDNNERHIVRKQSSTELRRKTVHQQVTTSIIERGAIEYQIPVDVRLVPPLL
jgi:hypothetical protein